MGIFNLDPNAGGGGGGNFWNFSNNQKDNYMEWLTGDLVEIRKVQHFNPATKQYEVFANGQPKIDFMITLLCEDGVERKWAFPPFTKDRATNTRVPTMAWQAWLDAIANSGLNAQYLEDIGGMNITLHSPAGVYNMNNPRVFEVFINGPGNAEFRGAFDFEPPKQAQPQPQPMQQRPMQQPVQQRPQQGAYINGQQRVQQAMNQARQASMGQPQYQQQPMYDDQVPYDEYYG